MVLARERYCPVPVRSEFTIRSHTVLDVLIFTERSRFRKMGVFTAQIAHVFFSLGKYQIKIV